MRYAKIFTCILAIAIPNYAMAAELVIGTPATVNAFPFGGTFDANPTTYQQVYSSTAFGSDTVAISAISFALASGTASTGTYSLSLSTTSKTVNGLSSNFASNLGSDNTTIFSGTLAGQIVGNSLIFSFSDFNYDPSAGNLLLNVNTSGIPSGVEFAGMFLSNDLVENDMFSRVHDFGFGFEGGLITTFTLGAVSGVPEPATWAMMLLGIAGVGAALRTQRSRKAAEALSPA